MLYEMLTGARPFAGDDVSQTIARVIEREPDWDELSAVAPPPAVRVIRRCLQKDVRQRFRDIGDVRLELVDVAGADGRRDAVEAAPRRSTFPIARRGAGSGRPGPRRRRDVAGDSFSARTGTGAERACRACEYRIRVPSNALLALDSTAADVGFDSTLLDLSPDGRLLVWVGSSSDGVVGLFARALDSFEIQPLAGTEGALHPFFSPDGRSLGLTNDKLKIHSFVTGTTTSIADVTTGVAGTWTTDDQIFFAAQERRRLFRVDARGGCSGSRRRCPGSATGTVALLPTESRRWSPYRQAGIGADFAQVRLVNLATNDVRTLTTDVYDARLTPGGTLVFGRSGRVFAARFDSERQTVGEPVAIASDVRMHALYPHLQLAVSDNALAFVQAATSRWPRSWVSRSGQTARAACLRNVRSLRRRPPSRDSGGGYEGFHPAV